MQTQLAPYLERLKENIKDKISDLLNKQTAKQTACRAFAFHFKDKNWDGSQ